jgi:hypothetical protein
MNKLPLLPSTLAVVLALDTVHVADEPPHTHSEPLPTSEVHAVTPTLAAFSGALPSQGVVSFTGKSRLRYQAQ